MSSLIGSDMFFLFSPFWLDVRNEQLWQGAQAIALRPKTFAVLQSLVAAAGQLLTQDELLSTVWGSTIVSETVIRTSIREIRTALDDASRHPQFIQTVHRRGYRFIAPVTIARIPPPVSAFSPAASQGTWRAVQSASTLPRLPVPEAPLDEEYKLVTVLCCTVTHAPGLAASRGPEAIYHLMQTFYAVAHEVVQHHHGTILSCTGDGCQAVFGAPLAQEDHARRAVLAALELHQQLQTPFADGAHVPRIGLHTGPVIAGTFTSAQSQYYTAVGETVREASQLQHRAAPGVIVMSATTYRLVQTEVRVVRCDTLPGDRAAGGTPVYAVQGLVRRLAGVVGYGTQHRSRFIGRQQELALLSTRLALVTQGHGQVVSLSGDPGMGKTRLLAEFHRSLLGQPVTYWEGHCFPYGGTTPYLLMRDVLRQLCDLTESDSIEQITTRVHGSLEEAGRTSAENTFLLLQLLGIPSTDARLADLSPQGLKSQTFALLRDLVLHRSREQPLILALENLHWIDATSEAWLTALVEHLAGATILLLVTHRPGYQPPWLTQAITTPMSLPPLLPEQSQAVIQSILWTTSFPDVLMQSIITRAAGNPFFLEELVWDTREQPSQQVVRGIPETIQSVLAARIDRLPPMTKYLLQTAAVIGTKVHLSLLQKIAELPEDTIQQSLTQLQVADFLYQMHDGRELVYVFKHALIHEVAYGSLLYERRRVLHARIMQELETLPADRAARSLEALAYHAHRGELWPQTLTYYRQAGEQALARSAHREAAECFEQALAALQHLPASHHRHAQAIDLRLAMRSALLPSGDLERILAYLHEAAALAETLHEPQLLGRVSHFLAVHYHYIGAYEQAIVAAQCALDLAVTQENGVLHALANQAIASVYYAQGGYHRALDCLTSFDDGGRHELRGQVFLPAVFTRILCALCHVKLGDFAEARTLGEESLRIAAACNHPNSLIFAHWGLGHAYFRQGNLPRAIPLLEQAWTLAQDLDMPMHLARTMAALGAAYSLDGRLTVAISFLTQALQHCLRVDRVDLKELCLLPCSEAQMLAGRLAEASDLARQALALSQRHKTRGSEAQVLRLLGDIAAQRLTPAERGTAAEAHYYQSLTLAQKLGMRPLQAHCHQRLGRLYAQSNRREQARTELVTAMQLYQALDMTFWLPQTAEVLQQLDA